VKVIEFPTADRPITDSDVDNLDVDNLHAEAFRDLESRLCDCVSMARIAVEKMPSNAHGDVLFAVCHSLEMLMKLQKDYYLAYDEKKLDGLHSSSV
jgi:hypothetical protein